MEAKLVPGERRCQNYQILEPPRLELTRLRVTMGSAKIKEVDREKIFHLIAKTLPYDQEASITILDVGAGYGALTQFLLKYFSNATAVCQDGSDEMAKLGRKRMKDLKGRVKYVLCDFSKPGWSRKIKGPFDAVVSSIAIHNVRSPDIIRAIYSETFSW